jgi:hypothetical protein
MNFKNLLFYCSIVTFLLIATGCDRNSTFNDTVVFEGHVYYGHMDQTTNLLVIDAAAAGAVITCNSYSESVKSADDGSYSLTIKGARGFQGIDTETYTLQASYKGQDEKITVAGKPGDTIKVRDFIVYTHTSE